MLYRAKKPVCMMSEKEKRMVNMYYDAYYSLHPEDWRDASNIAKRMYARFEESPSVPMSPNPEFLIPTLHTLVELGLVEIFKESFRVAVQSTAKADLENIVIDQGKTIIKIIEA